MRLISCYIENFGKLSKFSYDFNHGLNIIEKENGWGKSTLAAFIKAMFYGLEYNRKKEIIDRRRYMPWNGNKFGGYIIIEKDGIQYKIQRFFGRTDKSDKLTVYNMSKNMVTDDLGNNPGEQIWGIDRDSYEKTAFITLNDSSLLNDIISSKLGNIEDQEADMETSSKAVDLLDNEMVKIKAKRGQGGLLGDTKDTMTKLKTDLKQYKGSLATIVEIEDSIQKEEKKLIDIDQEITKIEVEQSRFILYEKKQQYANLKNDFDAKTNEHNEIESFFKEKHLSEEALHHIQKEASRYTNQKEQAKQNELFGPEQIEFKKLTDIFKEGIPELSEIEECNEQITALSNQQTLLKNLHITKEDKEQFTYLEDKYKDINIDHDIIEGYLNDFNQVAELVAEENKINVALRKSDEKSDGIQANKVPPLLFVGIGVFILSIFVMLSSTIIGVGIAAIGLVIGVVSIVFKSKKTTKDILPTVNMNREKFKDRLKAIAIEKTKLESGYLSFLTTIGEKLENIASSLANSKVEINEYRRFKKQILGHAKDKKEVENKISQLKEQIELFLSQYCGSLATNDYEKTLSGLRKNLSRFNELSKMNQLYNHAKKLEKKSEERLAEKFDHYYEEFPSDVTKTVNELTGKYFALKASKGKLKESNENKEQFELANNILELDQVMLPDRKNDELAEDLRKQKEQLSQEKNDSIKKIARYKKDINTLTQDADQIEDVESAIIQAELDIEALQRKHDLISLTKECMIEAKENLATKYMGDVSLMFKKYFQELNTEQTDAYQIDINLDVKVEHEGELHDGEQLSKGMKDLVQVCMRMALVEAVYKDVENPILVLDDPFVNLDDNRLEKAMKLLKKISSEYQIIYFICHNSRNVTI